jgi:RNA polymerase sigma factor (sigma-70 family)
VDRGVVRYELTDDLDRVVCATAIRCWRPGGPFDVDDVKQHARLAALEALPKHDGSSGLPGFVANAARWRIHDLYRDEAVEQRHRHFGRRAGDPHDLDGGETGIADPHSDFTEDVATRIDAASLARLMHLLRPQHQRVLTALYLVGQDRSYAVIAAEMGLPIDSLKSLRRRALEALRRAEEQQRRVAA